MATLAGPNRAFHAVVGAQSKSFVPALVWRLKNRQAQHSAMSFRRRKGKKETWLRIHPSGRTQGGARFQLGVVLLPPALRSHPLLLLLTSCQGVPKRSKGLGSVRQPLEAPGVSGLE